jgi:branched-subunit amino acid transport protein
MGGTGYMIAAIVGLTLVTIVTRSSFFMLPARIELPASVERALRYAPACALTAIITQGVLARNHQPYVNVHNYEMWAIVAAALVFAKTRNMIAMMVVGMAVFTALRLTL